MKPFDPSVQRSPADYVCDSCNFDTSETGYMEAYKENHDVDFPDSIYYDRFILCFDCYKDLPRKLAQ